MYDKFDKQKPFALLDTSKYPPEVVGRFNSFITTQFDDSLSVEMQMRSIIKWAIDNFKDMDQTYNDFTEYVVQENLNPFIQFLNDLIEYMNNFIETFDNKLTQSVIVKLNEWLDDGTLADIINNDVFDMKADKTFVDSEIERLDQLVDSEIERLDQKDENLISQLAQIAINPINFGAKFDGTDDTQPILDALEHARSIGNSEVLLTGLVGIQSEIEIPSGVTINSINATVKPLTDTNVFSFNRNTHIKGTMTIDVRHLGSSFTSDCLHFNGSKILSWRDVSVDGIVMLGNDAIGMGNAIHLSAKEEDSSISFVNFGRIAIKGFEYGVKIDAPEVPGSSKHNYINGNIFNDLTISDCDYYIYATGNRKSTRNHVDGNSFINMQLQYSARAKEIIHLEGWNNHLKGFVWDASYKDVLITNLTSTTRTNVIELYGASDIERHIDDGVRNYVNVLDELYDVISQESKNTPPRWANRYEGDFQNILHNADKLHTVNVLSGQSLITSGEIKDVFDGLTHNVLRLDLSNDSEFTFEIVFDGTVYKGYNTSYLYMGLKRLGLAFTYSRAPNEITIESTSHDGIVKTVTHDLRGRANNPYFSFNSNTTNGLGVHLSKVKITLKGQQNNDIQLSRVYANSYFVGGNMYLSNSGGWIDGDFDGRIGIGGDIGITGDMEFKSRFNKLILTSSNGSKYNVFVGNTGELNTELIE